MHPERLGVAAVDLVDRHDRPEPERQRLPGDEPRLRHRPLGGVHQDQHAVDHAQDALDLAAEVRVARRVDDVDLDALPADGRVLGQDGDPPLPLERVRVHDALFDLLVGAERPRLPEHLVHQGGLAVVDVRDDGNITDQATLPLRSERMRPGRPGLRGAYIDWAGRGRKNLWPRVGWRWGGGGCGSLQPVPPVRSAHGRAVMLAGVAPPPARTSSHSSATSSWMVTWPMPRPAISRPDPIQHPGMGRQVGHDRMAAHRHDPAHHGPDVEVVHRGHPRHLQDPPLDLGHGRRGGGRPRAGCRCSPASAARRRPGSGARGRSTRSGRPAVQPVSQMIAAAPRAPTEPSASPRTWR